MKRRFAIQAVCAAIAASGLISLPALAADTIKVGILHSLSGTMAISETTLKDVMLMLIDEQNAKGGLLGKQLEPVVVDPASDWPLFAEKARDLINRAPESERAGLAERLLFTGEHWRPALQPFLGRVRNVSVAITNAVGGCVFLVADDVAEPGLPLGVWPGQSQGLTARESEVLSLITQGLSNQEIADRCYLSINSVKTYIRTAYRKMGVTRRSQAVLWGLAHGFEPDHFRRADHQA